jgi:hypothetical protein
MSKYDQKNQRVENQYNADKIDIFVNSPAPTETELLGKGKNLIRTRFYPQAIKTLEQCLEINSDSDDTHYYLAIALLRGSRPKLISLSAIRVIENHLKIATQLQPQKGGAYVLWALVKYDFYVLNGMYDRPPSYQDLLRKNWSLSQTQAQEILSEINADGNFVWQWLRNQL